MFQKFFSFTVVAATALLVVSCEGTTPITVPLGETTIELPLAVSNDAQTVCLQKSEDGRLVFAGELAEFNLNDSMFDDIRQYIGNSNRIRLIVNSVSLLFHLASEQEITANVYNFRCFYTSDTVSTVYEQPIIAFEEPLADAQLQAFIGGFFATVQTGATLGMGVSGEVNAEDLLALQNQYEGQKEQVIGTAQFIIGLSAEITLPAEESGLTITH